MPQESNEVIICNKYHYDETYKFKDYNKNSIMLEKKNKSRVFIPKSVSKVFTPDQNGKLTVFVESWWYNKPENQKFFNE